MKRNTTITIGVVILAALALFWFTRKSSTGKSTGDTVVSKKGTTGKSKTRARRSSSGTAGDDYRSSVLMEDDPAGTLRLEGRVVNDTGDGVAKATVIIDSVPPRTVRTEDDGSFGIDKLVARPYRLVARAKEGVAGPVVARLNEKNDPVILRLRAASSVVFTVVDALEKKPINGATVELRGMDKQTATTDASGVATVHNVVPGFYNAVAYAPKYAKQHTWLRVDGKEEVRLELKMGAAVSGRVSDPDGKPLVNASVVYEGASSWAQQAHPRFDAVVTDQKGEFRFEAMPPGSFRFVARHKDFAPGSTKIIVLDGKDERRGVNITMEPPATLYGNVLTKEKDPVPSARVRVAVRVEGMDWSRPRQVFADDKGAYEIGALPRKTLQVVAMHENGSSEIVDIDMTAAPHRRRVDLPLDLTMTISGVVVDSAGEPVEGAQVWASENNPDRRRRGGSWRMRGFRPELTGAGGEFTIGSLRPGEYTLRANPPGADSGPWGGMGWRRKGTTAKAGDTNVKVVLEADATVKGKVAFANGDAPPLFTVGVGFRSRTPFTTKDGSFVLKNLPPNEYTLTIRGPFDTVTKKVKLDAGAIKDLGTITVHKGRTISGVVTANGSPVPGATVRAGTMVFGDGSSSKAAFQPPFARSTKETTTDDNGAFVIYGAVLGDVSLVAEHEAHGRSQSYAIRQTQQSVENVNLTLQPFGALEGRVTRNGQPVTKVFVSARSQTVPSAMFGVQTDDNGNFRFDRLAPDNYQVSAMDMSNGSMGRGMGSYSSVVAVQSGQTAKTEIKLEGGDLVLKVTPKTADGKPVNFAFVRAVSGTIKPKTSRELELAVAAAGSGYSAFSMAFMGMASELKGLAAGTYTACAVPFPNELKSPQEGFAYGEREGGNLPCFCQTVSLVAGSKETAIDLTVEIPKFVPAPNPG